MGVQGGEGMKPVNRKKAPAGYVAVASEGCEKCELTFRSNECMEAIEEVPCSCIYRSDGRSVAFQRSNRSIKNARKAKVRKCQ